jgi:nucleoid-associated protein YgaU
LVLGSIAPGFALAGEADSEQEGSAPPGALPGLEEAPELEPGGEEVVLEELPGVSVGGEESEEGPPLETEPVPAPSSTAEAVQPPTEEAPSDPAPPGPAYEPAPAPPPSAPVENQPLATPESRPPPQPTPHTPEAVQSVPEAPTPASPPKAPEPEAAPPAAVPVQRAGVAGSLAGHSVHTVRAGECLWSIAEALLPSGADNAEIEAEVQRLWRLNADRIGTGDPSLVYAGTELRLR